MSSSQIKWEWIDRAQTACAKPPTLIPSQDSLAPYPPRTPSQATVRATTLIRQRRSAVAFNDVTTLARDSFFFMLDALLPRARVPPWDALPWNARIHPILFVHRVEGLTPGLYAFVRHPKMLAELRAAMRPEWLWEEVADAPSHLPLYLLLPTDMRDVAQQVSCHQEIAADSVFAMAMLGEFEPALQQGAWWYRYLHWEAGMLGHVLYLEAEAHGLRATGIGCFFDDQIHQLLGLQTSSFQNLYNFTVGGAVEDLRIGTLPAYAHLAQ